MKRLCLLYILPLAWAFMACQNETDDYGSKDICLNMVVDGIDVTSRAKVEAEIWGFVPSLETPFLADVWFSYDSGVYPADNPKETTYVPCHTTMSFDGSLVYALYNGNNLKYDASADAPVYCVGFYPQGVWSTTDNQNVSATIDGEKDLMYAEEISGKWSEPLKEQTYRHLLTWLKVCICSTSQDAAAAWGKITSISIQSLDQVNVDLSTKIVSYSGGGKFVAAEDETLHTTMREVGSVFCGPATEYQVTIALEGNRSITKTIALTDLNNDPLTDQSQAVGKQFILTLYFNPYDVVEGVCTLNSWNAQNEDLYLN